MARTRRRGATLLVAVTLIAGAGLLFLSPSGGPRGPAGVDEATMVSVGDTDISVWPYLSPSPSFDNPSISVNVVIQADGDRVERFLLQESGFTWERSAEATQRRQTIGGRDGRLAAVDWTDSPGGERYLYVQRGRAEDWMAQSFQVNHGAYFGAQFHVRAYEPYDGAANVTLLQAHTEHFDWFSITHHVDGLQRARRTVERDFRGRPFVAAVTRVYWDNGDTFDADGWATVVHAAGALLLAGRLSARGLRETAADLRRRGSLLRRRGALFGGLAAAVLAVRTGGLLFEHYVPVGPDVVVATWYPVLIVGIPLIAYAGGRRLPARDAFAAAALGLGAGLVVDYLFLGVAVLPIAVMVHRVNVCVAAGLLAAGGSLGDRRSGELLAGAVLWACMVLLPHLA